MCAASQVGSFHWRKIGRLCVGLGCTKEALILSRDPNQSKEKHVQKETSLSSMAIELSTAHTTNQALEEIKAHNVGNVDGGLSRGKCTDTRNPGGGGGGGSYKRLSSAICLVSNKALKGSQPWTPSLTLALHGNSPHYGGMSIHAGHLHYP